MPHDPHFHLSSRRDRQRTILRACGRLVVGHGASSELWTSYLDRADGSPVDLDLGCVTDADAGGIGVVAEALRRAAQRGITVSVIAASRVVDTLVRLTRLDRAIAAWPERAPTACGTSSPGQACG
jgi:ABC-type transporter Mla MlaB component